MLLIPSMQNNGLLQSECGEVPGSYMTDLKSKKMALVPAVSLSQHRTQSKKQQTSRNRTLELRVAELEMDMSRLVDTTLQQAEEIKQLSDRFWKLTRAYRKLIETSEEKGAGAVSEAGS